MLNKKEPVFKVGDEVVFKSRYSYESPLNESIGTIVVVGDWYNNTKYLVDLKKEYKGLTTLGGYFDTNRKHCMPLKTRTGIWATKTKLKLAGPPDNDGDWI